MKKVATYGVFDLFHEGHVNLLRRARELGDYLIVGVTTNHFDEIRGKLNTTDSYAVRYQAVVDSGFADEVIPEEYPGQKIDDITSRGIDVMVFGSDWIGHFDYLQDLCEVVYLPRTQGISSTALRNARFPEVRVGIAGGGRIARRFVTEAAGIGGKQLVAAYNPNGEHARAFARETGIGQAFDDWDAFLDAVDAVYVASPHEYHFDQAKSALLAGKHVLCEKPLAFSGAQAEELFALAAERDLVLLEAVKTAYCPGFEELVSVVKGGAIGEVRDVEAAFTRLTAPGVRERDDAQFGGSFLEGYILAPAPWWLTTHFEVHHEDPDDVQMHDVAFLGSGLRYEISNFIHLVRRDDDRYPKLAPEESIAMASVFERYFERG